MKQSACDHKTGKQTIIGAPHSANFFVSPPFFLPLAILVFDGDDQQHCSKVSSIAISDSSSELYRSPVSYFHLIPSSLSLPVPLHFLHSIVIDSQLFVIGYDVLLDFWKLDLASFPTAIPSTHTTTLASSSSISWQQLPSPPVSPSNFACTALNNDSIVIAGGKDSSLVYSFVISENRWIALPAMSTNRALSAAVSFNSKLLD